MRLGGSTAEEDECAIVKVVGGEWPLGAGQLVKGEQPPGGPLSSRARSPLLAEGEQPWRSCSLTASKPRGGAYLPTPGRGLLAAPERALAR